MIKNFDGLLGIANKVCFLGLKKNVQKILVTVPERYEPMELWKILKDLSNISLLELINAFQAVEQEDEM